MMFLDRINKIHLIGIGGIGMSAIAEILNSKGFSVSGSDLRQTAITERLEQKGIKIFIGQKEENIDDSIDLVVHSSAVKEDNPEYSCSLKKNIKLVKRPEFLGELTRHYNTIGIAGVHGKTTTTSMVAKILYDSEKSPNILIGGNVPWLNNANASVGTSDYFIIEADEYDKTFLSLNCAASIITNLEHEHKDTYPTYDEEKETFIKFANNIPFYGFCLICADNKNLMEIRNDINSKILTYAIDSPADYTAKIVRAELFNQEIEVYKFGEFIGSIILPLSGVHNALNALGAISMCYELGVDFNSIKNSLANFKNADRRLQLKYSKEVTVIDDYAHHPTEVIASLKSIKEYTEKKVTVIFQPHLYTRTQMYFKQFAEALSLADKIILTEIYPAREKKIDGVSSSLILDELQKINANVELYKEKGQISNAVLSDIDSHEIIITMGAGDVWTIGEEIISELDK